ncbi:MAG: homoserine O-acetyltransferase [Thermoanaerobaculia bacterium]
MSFHLHISPETRFLRLPGSFLLDSGARLRDVEVAYRTWGTLAPGRDNAVVVCHALTGSADVDRWWSKLLGSGRALDPDVDFVVAANLLGSCYGSTGPQSPRTPAVSAGSGALPWGADFPTVTVRDQVRMQQRLLDALGVEQVRLVVGGSLGGMVALEFALGDSVRVEALAVLSAPAYHGPWGIALSELGRRALALDPKFRGGHYPADDPPTAGLALARAIAMTSYRSRPGFEQRFGRDRRDGRFEVERYLEHQGKKLVDRFDANSYLTLLGAMDSHDVARGRGSRESVLRALALPALVLSSSTDVLYPLEEQLELATLLPAADYVELASVHGHDAFLIDQEAVNRIVVDFRQRVRAARECRPALAVAGDAR